MVVFQPVTSRIDNSDNKLTNLCQHVIQNSLTKDVLMYFSYTAQKAEPSYIANDSGIEASYTHNRYTFLVTSIICQTRAHTYA